MDSSLPLSNLYGGHLHIYSMYAGELTVSVEYKKDFDEIQAKFAQLFYDITTMLEKAPEVTLEELKKLLIFYRDLRPLLQDADTITKVMLVVEEHSSFTNCTYLKAVADNFLKAQEGQKKIDTYEEFVETFCQHTLREHSYVTSFLVDLTLQPLLAETITLKLEWNPIEKTLTDIQDTLNKTFKSLACHIHIVVVRKGCVTVICYAPQYLMGALVRLAQENMKVLVESRVIYLSMGHAVLLDISAQKVKTMTFTL